jgi:hypothetical protein
LLSPSRSRSPSAISLSLPLPLLPTSCTGHPPEMPTFATGFWQCKNRYRSQDELLTVAREYKKVLSNCSLWRGSTRRYLVTAHCSEGVQEGT